MSAWDHPEIRAIVDLALREDIGPGDVTTNTCIPEDRMAAGRFYARQDIVLAGVELLSIIYGQAKLLHKSGDVISKDEAIAKVEGSARTLLTYERTALNFIQRLSGVATLARRYVDAVKGTKCRVLDTRKTTPGLRRLEKLAAAAGGVTNHRLALYDGVLIKNNHITEAGGVTAALERFRNSKLPVEIEIRSREELDEALAAGVQHVLLDNLTPAQAQQEIRYIAGRAKVELSGNIDLTNIRAYAETGADFVSSGAITHQAQSVNLNFRIEPLMEPRP